MTEDQTRLEKEGGDSPRIYVASLTDYNAGILYGSWLDVSSDPEELHRGITAMLATSPTTRTTGEPAEEWAIHDYEGWYDLRLDEYEALDVVTRLAEGVHLHGSAFAAWANLVGTTEPAATVEGFDEHYQGEFDDPTAYGQQLLDDLGISLEDVPGVPEGLRPYLHLDVAGWVRDMTINGDILVAESGGAVHIFHRLMW